MMEKVVMYGTVAHLRPKPGQEQGAIAYVAYWVREHKPQIRGVIGSKTVAGMRQFRLPGLAQV
jgi:hypothetical protein